MSSYFVYLTQYLNLVSLEKTTVGARQWKKAQESLLSLEKSNVASVDSIVRYANSI